MIKSKFMESYKNDLELSLTEIKKILKAYSISFVFLGGVARNTYGTLRMTEDIDILVDKKDKEKLLSIPIGYIKKSSERSLKLQNPKTVIDVLYSGDHAGNEKGLEYISPKYLEAENNMISLKAFIMYKLSSGLYGKRYKDYDDIQNVIKINKLSKTYAQDFREDLKTLYEKLWDEIYS